MGCAHACAYLQIAMSPGIRGHLQRLTSLQFTQPLSPSQAPDSGTCVEPICMLVPLSQCHSRMCDGLAGGTGTSEDYLKEGHLGRGRIGRDGC